MESDIGKHLRGTGSNLDYVKMLGLIPLITDIPGTDPLTSDE